MQISGSYETSNIWDLGYPAATEKREEAAQTTSGDSVEISNEARKLYSRMIHKYDKAQGGKTSGGDGSGAPAGGSGGGGGENTESVDEKIQSLKSQLAALASQMTGGASDQAVMSKMNALQAQIAALEAQKNA